MIGKILCKIGIHNWGKPKFFAYASSNVKDYTKKCLRCKKVKRWVESKEDYFSNT